MLGFRVWGLGSFMFGCRVWGVGFRVEAAFCGPFPTAGG